MQPPYMEAAAKAPTMVCSATRSGTHARQHKMTNSTSCAVLLLGVCDCGLGVACRLEQMSLTNMMYIPVLV